LEEEVTLADEYQRLCETPSDIYLHLPRFHALAQNVEHVIELGCRSGVSTVAWLHGLEGHGRLTSVDIDPAPPIGVFEHWSFIQGDDLDPAVIDQIEPADIVFIDTSHLYEQTLKELHTYRWLVKPGGLLVLHDTELAVPETAPVGHPLFPVRKAVDEFITETGLPVTFIKECWGLAVIRVV
jgi:predicted O-methyltransferase YrrM